MDINIEKATLFYQKVIVPEILSRWYTRPQYYNKIVVWCKCCSPENGQVKVHCAYPQCQTHWFHINCVNSPFVPKGDKYCDCCEEFQKFDLCEDNEVDN